MAKRVFFSFDYEDVETFRANVVRKHDLTKETRDDAGFFDASIWEKARKTGPEAIKRLIDDALVNTSATVVLIGSDTYARRWVRYEIFKSISKGNGMFGVHINSIKDKSQTIKALGPNPFDYLAIRYNGNGTSLEFLEWNNTAWQTSVDKNGYTLENQLPREEWSQTYQLKKWYSVYDWVADDGYENFATWVDNVTKEM